MRNRTRKYTLNTAAPAPSTGEMLSKYITDKRIYQSALARLLNRNQSAISEFRKGATIQTAILWEICHALKYNFFADIAAQLPADYPFSAENTNKENTETEVDSLQKENAMLKMERDMLKSMLETWVKSGGK